MGYITIEHYSLEALLYGLIAIGGLNDHLSLIFHWFIINVAKTWYEIWMHTFWSLVNYSKLDKKEFGEQNLNNAFDNMCIYQ